MKEEKEIRTMLKTGASLVDYKKIDKIIDILKTKDKELDLLQKKCDYHQKASEELLLKLRNCTEQNKRILHRWKEIKELEKVFYSVPQPCKVIEKWKEVLESKKGQKE